MGIRIVSLTSDLMFGSNILETLTRAGYEVLTVGDTMSLDELILDDSPSLILLDLHTGFDAADIATRGLPVLAYGRHTEPALLRYAREAGCVGAVPRSSFVEQMAGLVEAAIVGRPIT